MQADPITDFFKITINGTKYSDCAEAAQGIETAAKKYMLSEAYRGREAEYFGAFHGFEIGFKNKDMYTIEILLKGKNVYKTDYANSGIGAITRLENLFEKITLQPKIQEDEISYLTAQLSDAKSMFGKNFEYGEELSALLEKQAYNDDIRNDSEARELLTLSAEGGNEYAAALIARMDNADEANIANLLKSTLMLLRNASSSTNRSLHDMSAKAFGRGDLSKEAIAELIYKLQDKQNTAEM